MKAIFAALLLPLMAGVGTAQTVTSPGISLGQIVTLRQLGPHSTQVWAEYMNISQAMIERIRRQSPEVMNEVQQRYEKLPDAMSTSTDIDKITQELDAAIEKRISRNGGAMDAELRFLVGRFRTARTALQPVTELVEERERKQRVIAEVVVLIIGVLAEQTGPQKEQSDLQGSEKADRLALKPGNAPEAKGSPKYAITDWGL
jgi:hypothetical protein